jgi:hypothetical protein
VVELSPAAVAANTTQGEAFAAAQVPGLFGLHEGDMVIVRKAAAQAGLFIADAYVSGEGELTIVFGNLTANPIVPTAGEVYTIITVGSF